MKVRLSLALLTLFAVTRAFAGGISNIPIEDQVVLDASNPNMVPADKSREGAWMPTEKEAAESLTVIQAYLEDNTDENKMSAVPASSSQMRKAWVVAEIKKILAGKYKYRVQFWGVLRDQKKVMVCNFFYIPGPGHANTLSKWRDFEVDVSDGGYAFWRVWYDPVTKKVLNFDSNGYAALGNTNNKRLAFSIP